MFALTSILIISLAPGRAVAAARATDASASTQVVVQRSQPIEVAFANDLTGFASGFGASFTNAVQMAVAAHPAIRGFPIQVNVLDAPCGDPAADVAAATSIVANIQNAGVIGQLCSAGFDQSLPIYGSAGVVIISGSASSDALPSFGPTVFNRTVVADGDGSESGSGSLGASG